MEEIMKHMFTLTELTIVIGASLLTVALFAGAAANIKDDPKRIACAQTMRGIEQKTTAFENDNGAFLISANDKGKLWGAQLVAANHFSEDGYYDKWRRQPKNFECPAETRDRSVGEEKYLHPTTGIANSYDYGLNWLTHRKLSAPEEKTSVRANLKNPAQLIRMLEGTKFALLQAPTDVTERHGEGAGNVVFEDGHLEFMSAIPYRDSDNYKREHWSE